MKKIGRIKSIGGIVTGTSKNGNQWQKRECVLDTTTNVQFPSELQFELFNDRISMLDAFAPGMLVEITFEVESKQMQKMDGTPYWRHDVRVWQVNPCNGASQGAPQQPYAQQTQQYAPQQPYAQQQYAPQQPPVYAQPAMYPQQAMPQQQYHNEGAPF
ncbi:MAG: DUF3127 domain-containing protein [Muribaculaceae bacterium]